MLTILITLASLAGGASTARPDPSWPQAQCQSAYGKTACGYHCVAAYGEVKCAKTPRGACKAAYGEIVCSDEGGDVHPPPSWRKPPAHAAWPPAKCLSGYGQTACGYHCVAGYGEVRCARTPAGKCLAGYGKVVCGDPARYGPGTPQVKCLAGYGEIACGYACVAGYGEVRCARTPAGACQAAYGHVVCSE